MFGPHVNRTHAPAGAPAAAHLREAIAGARAHGLDARAAGMFFVGPRTRAPCLPAAEEAPLRAAVAELGVRLLVHSAYPNSNPWRGNPEAISSINLEYAAAARAGAAGLVVHLPRDDSKEAVGWVAKFGPRLLPAGAAPAAAGRPVLFLEHVASRPPSFETPAKLAALAAALDDRFGLCLDTAHLWSNGVDLRSRGAAAAWFAGFDAALAPLLAAGRVALHLNDSAYPRGDGRDAHAGLLRGEIWGAFRGDPAASGLAAVVAWARRHGVPTVLERKPQELLAHDYEALAGLIATLEREEAAARQVAAGPV